MKPGPDSSAETERIEQAAAAWVLRQDRGLDAPEQDAFLEWLAADPRHGPSLARHRQNWERLNGLVRWRPEHAGQPNRDLLAPRPALRWTQRHPWLVSLPLAAAAALAAAFFVSHRNPAAAPTVVSGSSNPAAAIEQHVLEDGSIVQLNRGAEVAVMYGPSERHVRLERGEAHFTVAQNPNRPFIVTVAGVDVRAVGTQFDVRLDGSELDVLVTEGRVRVGSFLPQVVAGEEVVLSLQAGGPTPYLVLVSPAETDRRLLWRPQPLDFTDAPLTSFVTEFNRHNPVELIIADPSLADIHLSARMRSDNLEGFVRLLERGFGIRAERVGNQIILRQAH